MRTLEDFEVHTLTAFEVEIIYENMPELRHLNHEAVVALYNAWWQEGNSTTWVRPYPSSTMPQFKDWLRFEKCVL